MIKEKKKKKRMMLRQRQRYVNDDDDAGNGGGDYLFVHVKRTGEKNIHHNMSTERNIKERKKR